MSTISRKHAKLLQKLYYNEAMYLGRDRLFHYVTKESPNDHPMRQQVMQWLKEQKVHQIHTRPPPRLNQLLFLNPRVITSNKESINN